MCLSKRAVMVLVVALSVTSGMGAQRPGGGTRGMFGGLPSMPALSNPTVGSGAEYLMTTQGRQMDIATVTLGKEDVDGGTGYWMETRMTSPESNGEMVMKTLTVIAGQQAGVKRMIMQQPGGAPMEMTGMVLSVMQMHPSPSATSAGSADARGELVGTETISVPAGTFSCQHYRKQEQNGPVDLWISTEITPYAMVKMTSGDTTMVLKKILTNETSHIKGEPQKFQMPQMPHP